MPEMRWWNLNMICPQCKTETMIHTVEYRADGACRFLFYCPQCRESNHWVQFTSQLQHRALTNDMENTGKAVPVSHRLPAPPGIYLEQDKKFLKDFKIGDPEDGA